jgi:phospholipid/cholesterol/gamma-HCH transport system permease protein
MPRLRHPFAAAAPGAHPGLALSGEGPRLTLSGDLGLPTLSAFRRALAQGQPVAAPAELDLSQLRSLDTPGALLLRGLREQGLRLSGLRPEHADLLALIEQLDLRPLSKRPQPSRWREVVSQIGRGAEEVVRDTVALIAFLGRASSEARGVLRHPRRAGGLPLASITRQIADTGLSALPIIGLMAVMIAVVIGYQGVAQLRPYGGADFTINLVAVSVLREMGVLITAIMVAGRSGSAFAAELGVMKSRQELDALHVMGLSAMRLLVLPRLIGLVITLPLLTFFADVMGLCGGALIATALLGVNPGQYLLRVHAALDPSDLVVGLLKAPVFALVIGLIGCMHGLRVQGSAESVGRETTRSVVKAIFFVIVLDALFSVVFEELGW